MFIGFSQGDQEGACIKDFNFQAFLDSTTELKSSLEPASKKRKIMPSSVDSNVTSIKNEVQAYLNEAPINFSSNPLVWWQANSYRYPSISKLASRLLTAPPSSVESERLFSIGGNIYSPKRNRLTSEHGEDLMFLNFNLRAFQFKY